MRDNTDADETEQTQNYSGNVQTAVGDDVSGGQKGTMSEAPEHVARKPPEEVTAEDIDYLDEQAKQELADVIGVDSVDKVYEFYGAGDDSDDDTPTGVEETANADLPNQVGGQTTESRAEHNRQVIERLERASEAAEADEEEDDDPEDEDDDPEPHTLGETGLVDDDGSFPWEDDDDVEDTELGTVVQDAVQVKGTSFDFVEPTDGQAVEQASQPLADANRRAGGDPTDEQMSKAQDMYRENCAHLVAFYDDTPLDRVYLVQTGKGKPNKIVSADRYPSVADHDQATPFWEALTDLDRYRMGAKAQMFIDDIDRFRQFNRT